MPGQPLASYRTYRVSARGKEPLLRFILEALQADGCRIIASSSPAEAPFRISFETPSGERIGILCYAFFANAKLTKNRPEDEHRFQVKYGSKDGRSLKLWQDPFGLYTTLFLGINTELGIFIGADPVLHSPTKIFISVEFKRAHAETILRDGWHTWERDRRGGVLAEPAEVLVGGTGVRFLDFVRFERIACGLDQGNRQLVAEKVFRGEGLSPTAGAPLIAAPPPETMHALARELKLSESEILDLISSARRLKMAVRGWVAEEHLKRTLETLRGVSECRRLDEESGSDVEVRFEGSRPLYLQCKNVLRQKAADGSVRLDFQKTRASKADPCTRYYRPGEFDLVAACLHAVTERWEFSYALPGSLDKHLKCEGRLSQNVRLDARWTADAASMLRAAAAA